MKQKLLVLTAIRDAETRALARLVFDGAGHRVIELSTFTRAESLLSGGLDPDLLLVEPTPSCPFESAGFRQLLKGAPPRSLCLILGIGDQLLREEASRIGIRYFITKPVTRGDVETLIDELSSPAQPRLGGEIVFPSAETPQSKTYTPADMPAKVHLEELEDNQYFLAASPKMLEIYRQAKLLADADVNVLILGESGTGKEVIAHLIHKYSRRSRNKFLKVNCAALPSDLLESELFGHKRGAFTGAFKDRAGRFEQANFGTLLLDEISEMSAQMQAKLLHVLQDGRFYHLGGQECVSVDVRVLAATNVQMESALLERTFREDLYYRLSVLTIVVPPLRERREEIPYLIEETIRRSRAGVKNGWECSFPPRLIEAALQYDWRGNIRELRNFVTRTIIMKDLDGAARELETKIAASSAAAYQDDSFGAASHSSDLKSIVRKIKGQTEVQIIRTALEVSGWNRRHAAQYLNISYRGLLYKIKELGVTPMTAWRSQ